jgi:hypothetical protein
MKYASIMILSIAMFVCAASAEKYVVGTGAACKTTDTTKAVKAQPASTTKSAPGAVKAGGGDTLVITGRLIEIAGKMPPNDLYNYVFIFKYRLVKVEKGAFTGQEILVGVYNPLIPRAQIKDKMAPFAKGDVAKFEMGAVQKLTLVKPIEKVWKDAVEDNYMDSEEDKYYALRVDVSK